MGNELLTEVINRLEALSARVEYLEKEVAALKGEEAPVGVEPTAEEGPEPLQTEAAADVEPAPEPQESVEEVAVDLDFGGEDVKDVEAVPAEQTSASETVSAQPEETYYAGDEAAVDLDFGVAADIPLPPEDESPAQEETPAPGQPMEEEEPAPVEEEHISEDEQGGATFVASALNEEDEASVSVSPDEEDSLEENLFGEIIQKEDPHARKPRAKKKTVVLDTMADKEAWRTDMPGSQVSDIRSAVALNDRILFINELFGEDPALYGDTVARLNSMSTLDEAVSYLREHFPEWKTDSDTVYRFMMIVRRKLRG